MAPGIGNKRAQHLRRARASQAAKKRKIEEDNYLPQSVLQFLDVEEEQQGGPGDLRQPQVLQPSFSHWEDFPVNGEDQFDSDRAENSEEEVLEEEVEVTDSEEDDLTFDGSAFEAILKGNQRTGAFEAANFPYQRGPKLPLRSHQTKKKAARELATSAKGRKIYEFLKVPNSESNGSEGSSQSSKPTSITQEESLYNEREKAIKDMERKLNLFNLKGTGVQLNGILASTASAL